MPRTIERDELNRLIANGSAPVIVEALPEKYYRKGHLPGAKQLPHDQVNERAPSVAPDKAAPIVVYCANTECANSQEAAAELEKLGYADVAVYPGGKKDWQEAGLALVKD